MTPQVEDEFRVWAFHLFYRRTFADDRDHVRRFMRAIVASAQPIERPELVAEWRKLRKAGRLVRFADVSAAGG